MADKLIEGLLSGTEVKGKFRGEKRAWWWGIKIDRKEKQVKAS